jgi:Ca2+-binding EF-hand superfamily protein
MHGSSSATLSCNNYWAHLSGCLALFCLQFACSRRLGTEISDAEAKEAIRILDSSNTGYILFGDFVEWYIGLKPSRQAKEEAANAQ